jgi:hypothetical protein
MPGLVIPSQNKSAGPIMDEKTRESLGNHEHTMNGTIDQNKGSPSSQPRRKQPVEVITEILTVADGRDKTFKLIQYTSRLILRTGSTKALKPFLDRSGLSGPLNPLVSHLSMFRKIIRLGNWISTLSELCEEWKGVSKMINKDGILLLIDLYTEIFDDIYCLGKMGILKNKRLLQVADVQAVRGWFYSILFGLHTEFVKYQARQVKIQTLNKNGGMTSEQKAALKEEVYASSISTTKMFCDLVFCGIDYFELDADPAYQIVTGLASGVLGYHKLYRKLS